MLNIIPKPTNILSTEGGYLLSSSISIQVDPSNEELKSLANYLSTRIQRSTGLKLETRTTQDYTGSITLGLDDDVEMGEEGYQLNITTTDVRLRAMCPAGLFYAIQTLLQIIPPHPTGTVSLPAVSIHDTPRFVWRGAMLDVARHFFGSGGCQTLH